MTRTDNKRLLSARNLRDDKVGQAKEYVLKYQMDGLTAGYAHDLFKRSDD